MSDTIASSALIGCVIVAFFGSMGVRAAPHLDGKLAEFRRSLLIQMVGLGVFAIGLTLARNSAFDGSPRFEPNRPIAAADLVAVRLQAAEGLRQQALHLCGLVVVLVANLPMLLHLLRELQSFVLHHRTDLLARDQVAGETTKG
jgi:hypothetical protein